MISDRGPQFTSIVFKEILKALKMEQRLSTTFHPQMDGQMEQLNQELEVYLCIFCANELHSWSKVLPIAEFAHNQCAHEELKQTLFQLMYGTNPVALPLAIKTSTTTAPTAAE